MVRKLMLMPEWFNASAGFRYATGMLMQCVVIAAGLSPGLSQPGWEWSKVQRPAASSGVGIGFDLQRIVANFISELIVLFERPNSVGDIITVAGAEGAAQQCPGDTDSGFRSQGSVDPQQAIDHRAGYRLPLSGSAVRIVVPVGVAYGSDVGLARQLLLEAALENETVPDDPEPMASFDDFGDDALPIAPRYCAAEYRLVVWTLLRGEINGTFEAVGIVMAFPQRDVHVDIGQPMRIDWDKLPPFSTGQATGGT